MTFNPDVFPEEDAKPIELSREPDKLREELQKLANSMVAERRLKLGSEALSIEEKILNSLQAAYKKYTKDLLIVEQYRKEGNPEMAAEIEKIAWMNLCDKISQIKAKGYYEVINLEKE